MKILKTISRFGDNEINGRAGEHKVRNAIPNDCY